MELDPRNTAIVVVHMMRDIVSPGQAFGQIFAEGVERHQIVPQIDRLLSAARATGGTPVYLRVVFGPGHRNLVANAPMLAMAAQMGAAVEGTPGVEIVPELAPHDGELVIDHQRVSGFFGTQLDVLLRAAGITTVVVCGVATNVTVEGTARDAVNLGYRTVLAADACSTASDEAHQATLETFHLLGEVATVEEITAALQGAAPQ